MTYNKSKPFPPPDGMTPFWRKTPGDLDNHRTTEFLPSECDVLIIGAGYSGGALVTHLLAEEESRNQSIVVVEARQLCSGATGRNGGHLKPDIYNHYSTVAQKHGIEAANEIAEFEVANTEAVRDYIVDTGTECDFVMTQAIEVQFQEKHDTSLNARVKKFIADGGKTAKNAFYAKGRDAEMISGIKGAKGAYKFSAGHLWPYKLIHSMFARALSHDNINLQTNTPVTSIPDSPDADGRWTIPTERGTVRARKVIMATNAYTSALLPEYRDKIIPYRTACSRIVTPETKTPPFIANSYVLRFNEWDFDYLIPRTDGSIIVGGARRTYLHDFDEWYGNVDDTKVIEKAKHYFDGYMQKYFRGWEDSGAYTDQVWSGIMGYSADRFPRFGKVPGRENMFIMAGFTGHGMPQIFLGAKGLSKMVLHDVPFSETGLPRLFEETPSRLASRQNFPLEMYNNLPSSAKL